MTHSTKVILVPGWIDSVERVATLAHYLRGLGIDVRTVMPRPNTGIVGIDVLAWRLAKYIEHEFPPQQPLALVGFSMGGLICRCYLQQLGGILRTRRLITLSTPHNGTQRAWIANLPALIQMRPGSDFLCALNADLSLLQQIPFTSIWTRYDITIWPPSSSFLPVGEMITISTPIHHFVPLDRTVWRLVGERVLQETVEQWKS